MEVRVFRGAILLPGSPSDSPSPVATGSRMKAGETGAEIALSCEGNDATPSEGSREEQLRRRLEKVEKELTHVRGRFSQAVQRLESFRAAGDDGVISTDGRGRIVGWNRAACEIFGYGAEEVLGRSLLEMIPGLDLPELSEVPPGRSGATLESAGLPRALEGLKGLRKGGGELTLKVTFWGWTEGEDRGFDVLVRDLTERWVTRMALESVSRTHEALLTSSPEGIVCLDPRGRTTFVNPAAERLLGWQARDLLGQAFHDFAHSAVEAGGGSSEGSPHAQEECSVLAPARFGDLVRAESFFTRKDGTPLPVSLCVIPLLSGGDVEGVVVLFQDISARCRAERALRASEARYRKLFRNSPIGMIRLSLEGVIHNANLSLARTLGFETPEELEGSRFGADLGGDWAAVLRTWKDGIAGDRLEPTEIPLRRRDGTEALVRVGGIISRAPEGEPEAVEMILEDLSERRALEDQLRQAQKMDALGKLTAGIAHDFNNELSIMRMSADLLGDSVKDVLPEAFEEVEAILDATRRASEITRHLLGFSRQAELRLLPMDVGWLMKKFSGILRVVMPERIQVSVDFQEAGGVIRADPVAVEQILLNLVTNARDAMPHEGALSLAVSNVEVEVGGRFWQPNVEQGSYVRISVTDSGTGMDPTTVARAFEPFFSTKAPGDGTGLGLAMVYGLMKQHGGFVDIRSRPGEGTTVSLLFPRSEERSHQMETLKQCREGPGGERTILVVEDEPAVRTLAKRMLERSGFRVLSAADGMEGLKAVQDNAGEIHLILSDLEMPRMGGLDLFQRLREEGKMIPFILASGYQSVSGLQEISGGWREDLVHLQKPWTRADILRAVDSAFAGAGSPEGAPESDPGIH